MEKEKTRYKRKILSLLLKKYENSSAFRSGIPSKQRPQITIAKSELAKDYEDEMDYRKKEWIHEALQELVGEGIIEVTWPKLKENIQVQKIYLNYEGVDKAYQLLGETPKEVKLHQLAEILAPLAKHPWDWVRSWQQECCTKLDMRKPSGLDLDDPLGYIDLVRVLNTLPEIEDSIPKRVFSQSLFQDSKYFERNVESRLVGLLRKIYPEEFEKDEEYLDQLGIINNPKLTLLCGSMVLRLDKCYGQLVDDVPQSTNDGSDTQRGATLDLGMFPGGLGLSAESVKQLQIQDIPAKSILLVENLTTFQEVLGVSDLLSPPMLVVYLGGFPNKTTQKLLKKLSIFLIKKRIIEEKNIFHWGDIDYGGIRIFEYLRRNFFPNLKPYCMDVKTYLEYHHIGTTFGEEQARKLQALLADASYKEWFPLVKELLHYRKRVEQESIRITGTLP